MLESTKYCRECYQRLFGVDKSDFEGIIPPNNHKTKRGVKLHKIYTTVICDGCGWKNVDYLGNTVEQTIK